MNKSSLLDIKNTLKDYPKPNDKYIDRSVIMFLDDEGFDIRSGGLYDIYLDECYIRISDQNIFIGIYCFGYENITLEFSDYDNFGKAYNEAIKIVKDSKWEKRSIAY